MEVITLASLKGGAVVEMFDENLQKVIENIADPNTDPEKVRTITLKFKIKPDKSRSVASIDMSADCKLANFKPPQTMMQIGYLTGGEVVASEIRQEVLPGFEVIPIAKGVAK